MAFQVFSPERREEVMEQFFEESLYNFMSYDIQDLLCEKFGIYEAEVWDEAKSIAYKSFLSKEPFLKMAYYIKELDKKLSEGIEDTRDESPYVAYNRSIDINVVKNASLAIRECVLSILVYTSIFDSSSRIPDSLNRFCREKHSKMYAKISVAIANKRICYDYDYVSNQPLTIAPPSEEAETGAQPPVDSAEVERLRATVGRLESENEELKAEIEFLLSEAPNCDPSQKVAIEAFLSILQKAGVSLYIKGNKTSVARLGTKLLKIPIETIKSYITKRDLDKTYHKDAIKEVNSDLENLGLETI